MSDKILVPIEMRNVSIKAMQQGIGDYSRNKDLLLTSLEAALLWQNEKLNAMLKPSPRNETQAAYNAAIEDVRRMFLAPEPVFDATLGGALLGRTFTREQANAIKNIIDTAVHG